MVTRSKLKVYGLVFGIFALGAGTGAGTAYAVSERRLANVLAEGRPEAHETRRFHALARELDLSREQREKLRGILSRHREQNRQLTRAMFETCGADMSKLRERVDDEIRGLLDEQQKQRFAELAAKRGKRFPLGRPGPKRQRDDGALQ